MQFGISLSHRQLKKLNIDLTYALKESVKYQFSFIRLSLYWDEIEKDQNHFDFKLIKKILNFYQKNQQKIILTIGLKAQRWPEFYWPEFIKQRDLDNQKTRELLFNFLEKSIKELKNYSCIKYWQLENEPLDPSGVYHNALPLNLLQEEANVIKKNDHRSIILSVWGNELIKRNLLKDLVNISNHVGLDLYHKQFVTEVLAKSIYLGPRQSIKQLKKYLAKFPRTNFWITEMQAEPWEKNEENYLSDRAKSMNPQILLTNLKEIASLDIEQIIFWGFEYWLWQKKRGNKDYFQLLKNLRKI